MALSRRETRETLNHATRIDEESRRDANVGALGYGKLAFQNLLVLQGGALVAIPAFASLVGGTSTPHAHAILGTIFALLVTAIISAALGILCAFFSLAYETDFYNARANGTQKSLIDELQRRAAEEANKLPFNSIPRPASVATELAEIEKSQVGMWRKRQVFRLCAIALAIFSMSMMALALFMGARLLMA